jgi:alanine racemase
MPRATVDLLSLENNLRVLRDYLAPGTKVMAAVKGNAYGHGACEIAGHLASCGVEAFGVATAAEALALRHSGITAKILIFNPVFERIAELIDYGVSLTVVNPESLAAISASGATSLAGVHLKVDTGMGRLGLNCQHAFLLALEIARAASVELEGVWTHLARADEENIKYTHHQLDLFANLLDTLDAEGLRPPLVHTANSAGIIGYPNSHFDMVRPGIALYGYHPSATIAKLEPKLKAVLSLSAPVTFVKAVHSGTPISYNGLWTAAEDTVVATVRCGYADGYPRLLSNVGRVRFGNHYLKIVGRVCMDQMMVDARNSGISVGDRVQIFGPEGPDPVQLAESIGTISYELLTSIAPRVDRTYV